MTAKRLKLFISGHTATSAALVKALERICEERFPGQFEIETIDIADKPALAQEFDVMETPTLLGDFAPSVQRLIGDLANADHLVVHLKRLAGSP